MDEIVRRLRSRDAKKMNSLKESFPVHGIREEEEDDLPVDDIYVGEATTEEDITPEEDMPDEEIPDEGDDSLAPPQGSPDMDMDDEEVENPDTVDPNPPEEEENPNPLDNIYAVNYQLGQEVVLAYDNGTKSKLVGIIEGYDTEGFYRIRWSNGKITNGITDLALADLVDTVEESKCVCGSKHFVNEGKKIVCDECGRIIRESKDPLAIADKKRPAGKRMIRSEAHPVSTAMHEENSDLGCNSQKKSLKDSIRSALSKKSQEDIDEEAFKSGDRYYGGLPADPEYRGPGKSARYHKELVKYFNDTVAEYPEYSVTGSSPIKIILKTPDGQETIDLTKFDACADTEEAIEMASHYFDDSLFENIDEDNPFSNLSELKGEFWTRTPEMLSDIRALGYDVLDANSEYIIIGIEDDEGEDHQLQIPVTGTSRTITLDIDKSRIV